MENRDILFSIVVPTYNRAHLIDKTLKSLLNQDYESFEIIVVDDGGKDNTEEVVANFKNNRIKYIWKENEERAVARNTGAQMAKGDYINFFDSDDLAYPNHLSTAIRCVRKYQFPEVFHLAYDIKTPEGELEKKIDYLPKLLNEVLPHGNILSCNGVFIRKDIALQFPFNNDRYLSATEDWELWLRLASRFPFYNENTVSTTVIDHEFRSVIKVNKEKLIKRKALFIKYLQEDDFFMTKFGSLIDKMTADSYTYIALHLAIASYPLRDVLVYLFKSLTIRKKVIFERRFWGAIKTLIRR